MTVAMNERTPLYGNADPVEYVHPSTTNDASLSVNLNLDFHDTTPGNPHNPSYGTHHAAPIADSDPSIAAPIAARSYSVGYQAAAGVAGAGGADCASPPVAVAMVDDGHFGTHSRHITCPTCLANGQSVLVGRSGPFSYFSCFLIFMVGGVLGCCLIPFVCPACQDVEHHCANCGHRIALVRKC